MLTKFQLLEPADCDEIIARLNDLEWYPGVSPSDAYKEKVKRNLEIPMGKHDGADRIFNEIIRILMQADDFTRRTLPKHIGRPRFNRSMDGGFYGRHADSAFMGNNPEIRTDISMTLFLDDPDTYEGGDLIMEFASGMTLTVKEPKGTIVFYPSGVMHHTTPVTSGVRTCFVAWVESHIQDPQKRDILTEMTDLVRIMEESEHNLTETHIRLTNIKHNLYRQWMGKA